MRNDGNDITQPLARVDTAQKQTNKTKKKKKKKMKKNRSFLFVCSHPDSLLRFNSNSPGRQTTFFLSFFYWFLMVSGLILIKWQNYVKHRYIFVVVAKSDYDEDITTRSDDRIKVGSNSWVNFVNYQLNDFNFVYFRLNHKHRAVSSPAPEYRITCATNHQSQNSRSPPLAGDSSQCQYQ